MKKWCRNHRKSGPWVEELDVDETQREVQPLIDRIFDKSKLKYTLGFTEKEFLKQADWIGAVLPGGMEAWDLSGPVPEHAHLLHVHYSVPFIRAVQSHGPTWMYTVLPGAWGTTLPVDGGTRTYRYSNVAERAWRWPPHPDFLQYPYVSGPNGLDLAGGSPSVVFDSTAQWVCVQDIEGDCFMAGAPAFMEDFFQRCPGGETGRRWRGVDAYHKLHTKHVSPAELNLGAFKAFHIRRIEPRANACARERMATLWPYEPATIPLGSKWDGPTPDDAPDQGYLRPF